MSSVQLIRMTPTDISLLWDRYAPGFERGLPGFIGLPTHEVMNNMLQAALAGGLQMWALGVEGEKREIVGAVLTSVADNPIVGMRSMWLYGISPHRFIAEEWREGLELLKKVAARYGCHQIQTFVRRKRMIEALKEMGAEADTYALTWRID